MCRMASAKREWANMKFDPTIEAEQTENPYRVHPHGLNRLGSNVPRWASPAVWIQRSACIYVPSAGTRNAGGAPPYKTSAAAYAG